MNNIFKKVSQIIRNSIHVDDLFTGWDSKKNVQALITVLFHVLKKGGFSLLKWTSNDPEVIAHLPNELTASLQTIIVGYEAVKILVLLWIHQMTC